MDSAPGRGWRSETKSFRNCVGHCKMRFTVSHLEEKLAGRHHAFSDVVVVWQQIIFAGPGAGQSNARSSTFWFFLPLQWEWHQIHSKPWHPKALNRVHVDATWCNNFDWSTFDPIYPNLLWRDHVCLQVDKSIIVPGHLVGKIIGKVTFCATCFSWMQRHHNESILQFMSGPAGATIKKMAADTGAQINMDSVAQPGKNPWGTGHSELLPLHPLDQEAERQWSLQQRILLWENVPRWEMQHCQSN